MQESFYPYVKVVSGKSYCLYLSSTLEMKQYFQFASAFTCHILMILKGRSSQDDSPWFKGQSENGMQVRGDLETEEMTDVCMFLKF